MAEQFRRRHSLQPTFSLYRVAPRVHAYAASSVHLNALRKPPAPNGAGGVPLTRPGASLHPAGMPGVPTKDHGSRRWTG